jgi:hypothetical protein
MKKLFFLLILAVLFCFGSGVTFAQEAPGGNNKPVTPDQMLYVSYFYAYVNTDCRDIQADIDKLRESFKDTNIDFKEYPIVYNLIDDSMTGDNISARFSLALDSLGLEKQYRNKIFEYVIDKYTKRDPNTLVTLKAIEEFLILNKITTMDVFLSSYNSPKVISTYNSLKFFAYNYNLAGNISQFMPPFFLISEIDMFKELSNPDAPTTPGDFYSFSYFKDAGGKQGLISDVLTCVNYMIDPKRDVLNPQPCVQVPPKPPSNKNKENPLSIS